MTYICPIYYIQSMSDTHYQHFYYIFYISIHKVKQNYFIIIILLCIYSYIYIYIYKLQNIIILYKNKILL